MVKQNEFVLYGLSEHKAVIDKIAEELNISGNYFNLRLILTEALTNAFDHGNHGDAEKPICLKYTCYDSIVEFQLIDCGECIDQVQIPQEICDSDLLNTHGKGLFLINSLAQDVIIKNNSLFIKFAI